MKSRFNKGFTLVELSIVLVIIGLLIGGILVAQSLIQSAAINSTVSQLSQYDAAVVLFKDKYRQIPGDSRYHGGDGNGAIEQGALRNHVFAGEIANFWSSLLPEEFVEVSNPLGSQPITSGANKNAPESAVGKTGSFIIGTAIGVSSTVDVSNPQNSFVILDPSQASSVALSMYRFSSTNSTNSAMKPAEMLSIDRKIDDSLPDSGAFISGSVDGVVYASGPAVSGALATCSSAGTYRVENDSYECTPVIVIGAQVGDL